MSEHKWKHTTHQHIFYRPETSTHILQTYSPWIYGIFPQNKPTEVSLLLPLNGQTPAEQPSAACRPPDDSWESFLGSSGRRWWLTKITSLLKHNQASVCGVNRGEYQGFFRQGKASLLPTPNMSNFSKGNKIVSIPKQSPAGKGMHRNTHFKDLWR